MNTKKSDYDRDYADWKRTLPNAPHHVIHAKVLAHASWREQSARQAESELVKAQTVEHKHEHVHRFPRWAWYVLGFLAALAIAPKAHCQFSHVNYINWQSGGSNISGAFFTYPFNINCSSNLTCTVSGNTLTMVAGSGATVAWDAILNPTAGGLSISQFANGNDFWIVKRKTDTSPTGSFFRFQTAAGADLCALSIAGAFTTCTIPWGNLTGTATAGGDLGSTYPNPTVTNGSHITNSSIPNSGLVNTGTTVNGNTCTLGSTCSVSGVTNTQTGNYTMVASDLGKLVIMNCSSACTVTLNGSPTNGFYGAIESIGSSLATLSLNGKNWNTGATVPVLVTGQDILFWSDGTNYFGDKPLAVGTGLTSTVTTAGVTLSLTNTSTTVAGQTCTLGSTCTITHECSDGIGDGLNAIPAGTYLATNCFNDFGATYTITAIRCFTDNNGTSTLNAANDAATGLLTGAVTCTNSFASGTQSGTTTIATSHWINFTFVSDGATKRTTFEVTVTR